MGRLRDGWEEVRCKVQGSVWSSKSEDLTLACLGTLCGWACLLSTFHGCSATSYWTSQKTPLRAWPHWEVLALVPADSSLEQVMNCPGASQSLSSYLPLLPACLLLPVAPIPPTLWLSPPPHSSPPVQSLHSHHWTLHLQDFPSSCSLYLTLQEVSPSPGSFRPRAHSLGLNVTIIVSPYTHTLSRPALAGCPEQDQGSDFHHPQLPT